MFPDLKDEDLPEERAPLRLHASSWLPARILAWFSPASSNEDFTGFLTQPHIPAGLIVHSTRVTSAVLQPRSCDAQTVARLLSAHKGRVSGTEDFR